MVKTALLVLDTQIGMIANYPSTIAHLFRFSSVIQRARKVSIQVIFVTTAFRAGYVDLHSRTPNARSIAASNVFIEDSIPVQIHQCIATSPSDIFVTKKRISAFVGSDLDLVLRTLGIEHLVLAGVTTIGSVLSTALQAADLDYGLTILEDMCMDYEEDVHSFPMQRVLRYPARVVGSALWLAEIERAE